jgi:hypothetical protein
MTTLVSFEHVATLATQLSSAERLRLVERIAHDLAASAGTETAAPRPSWESIRGIAPNLLGGEDAQEWVSRSRKEADEHRENQLRQAP